MHARFKLIHLVSIFECADPLHLKPLSVSVWRTTGTGFYWMLHRSIYVVKASPCIPQSNTAKTGDG